MNIPFPGASPLDPHLRTGRTGLAVVTRHAQHFDEFQPHTRLKHAILDTYIVAWAMKLLMWGRAGHRLAIVDAFAGTGRDARGNEGSPVIAVRRARQAMDEASARQPELANAEVHVFAIESDRVRFRQLEENLAPFAARSRDLVHVLRGSLSDHIDGILAQLGPAPTFLFLDPFGIKGLDAATYPKVLSGRHNEIFALFSDIGAVRLHGLISAEHADPASEVERILTTPSLFPEYDRVDIEAARAAAGRTNDALDSSVPASRGHLTRALGGEEWVTELEQSASEARADVFLKLFRRRLVKSGAQHVLTVPMRNDAGQRVYALVHASKSRVGLMTMKECVSAGLRRGVLADNARTAIMADLGVDTRLIVENLSRELAGVTVPWADEQRGLRSLLLAHSPLFHFQADELKSALKSRGILRRDNRKEVCIFPPTDSSARA